MMNTEKQDVFDELSNLVETLTTSGNSSLDQNLFKRVKNICKSSDENVHHLYRIVSNQLEKEHAEIRLSSFHIIQEIFSRSHVFRELLTDNFQRFLELTIGTNLPLPEPSNVAAILKTQSFQAIEKWQEQYGPYYKKLALGYKYLKRVKKFEFDGVRSHSVLERQQAQDLESRRTNLSQNKLNIVLTQMEETVTEIKTIVTEMENCFCLILPRPEEFDVYKEAGNRNALVYDNQPSTSQHGDTGLTTSQLTASQDTNTPCNDNNLNHHGLTSRSYQLNITLSTLVEIVETEDNKDILNTVKEQHKQITSKYLPLVQKWLDILTRHSGNSEKLIEAIDLRHSLTMLKQKFEKLKIISKPNSLNGREAVLGDEGEEKEEAFVDVPEKEGIEHVPAFKRHEYGLEAVRSPSSNLSKTCKDQNTPQISRAGNTFLWNSNGYPDDCVDLADPCSRATAVASLKRKHNERNSSTSTITKIQDSLSVQTIDLRKEETDSKDERQTEFLKRAPVVPFDMDLYNWGRPDHEAPSVSNLKSLHCFWVHGNDDNDDHCPGDIRESMQSRSIKFTGEFKAVKWACRAPLANGKLCPRMDRYKCPFHGKIIPRDEMGQPADSVTDGSESLVDNTAAEVAEITRDVELAIGVDLGSEKRTKGKKRKYPGLTDLKKNADTSRSRLENIVFDKSSLQRVSSEMDKVRKCLIDEKFGNNFNYALRQ